MTTGFDDVNLPAGFVQDLADARSQTEVLDAAARWISTVVDAQRSSVKLLRSDGASFEVRATRAERMIPDGSTLPKDGTVAGRAIDEQRSILIDVLAVDDGREAPYLLDLGIRSLLVTPMIAGGFAFGTLNLGRAEANGFAPKELALMASIATLIASFLTIHGEAEQALSRSMTDELTGQLNRRAILERLRENAATSSPPSLLYLDVDNFKAINDAFGHARGDEVLCLLTARIADALGPDDLIGRLGGDEFLVVVCDDPDGTRGRSVAQAVLESCTRVLKLGELEITPAISIGVAIPDPATVEAATLLAEADMAMYAAKRSREHIAVADSAMHRRAQLEATIDRELDDAFESGALRFFYQPVRSLLSGDIVAAEALLRWNHPNYGWIPTPLLLERIEATGRTRSLTLWTLETVAQNWTRLRHEVPRFEGKQVSLNLSPRQLAWVDYADAHTAVLHRHGLDPGDLVIEVVESTEIQPGDKAEQTLRRIGASSVTIALDDFGTGHNALGYFTRFPIHVIKFDRSLVGSVVQSSEARTILRGLSRIADELGVLGLAEGIETQEESDACLELGIHTGQGWHLGRPMGLDDLIELAALESAADASPRVANPFAGPIAARSSVG